MAMLDPPDCPGVHRSWTRFTRTDGYLFKSKLDVIRATRSNYQFRLLTAEPNTGNYNDNPQ